MVWEIISQQLNTIASNLAIQQRLFFFLIIIVWSVKAAEWHNDKMSYLIIFAGSLQDFWHALWQKINKCMRQILGIERKEWSAA